MNYNYNPYSAYQNNEGERFFLAAPFLVGALAGGAIASTAGPRPVYVSSPPVYNQMPPVYQNQNAAYGNASYSYYYPVHTRTYKNI
ncbi:MAG: hypothetical protein R3Y13_01460 [bacterium]